MIGTIICQVYKYFEIKKNEIIIYSKSVQKHERIPSIIIQNNNVIYAIGNDREFLNSFGAIEYFIIRDTWLFEIDKFNKIFNLNDNKKIYFRCVLNTI